MRLNQVRLIEESSEAHLSITSGMNRVPFLIRHHLLKIVPWAIGMLLVLSGFSKLQPYFGSIGDNFSYALLGPRLFLAVSLLEFWLGSWMVVAKKKDAPAKLALILFLSFAAYNAHLMTLNTSKCNCFGETLSVSPLSMLAIDFLLSLLTLSYLLLLRSKTGRESRPTTDKPKQTSWATVKHVVCFGLTLLILAALYCSHSTRFGREISARVSGLPAALVSSHMGGHAFGCSASVIVTDIHVKNVLSTPIELVGYQQSCKCPSAAGFPRSVEPGKTATVTLFLRAPKTPGSFSAIVSLFAKGGNGQSYTIQIPVHGYMAL